MWKEASGEQILGRTQVFEWSIKFRKVVTYAEDAICTGAK
jgi:hypothetical protein